MHDDLRTGIDRPRGRQYALLLLIITLMAIAGYFYRRERSPLRLEADPKVRTSNPVASPEVADSYRERAA